MNYGQGAERRKKCFKKHMACPGRKGYVLSYDFMTEVTVCFRRHFLSPFSCKDCGRVQRVYLRKTYSALTGER